MNSSIGSRIPLRNIVVGTGNSVNASTSDSNPLVLKQEGGTVASGQGFGIYLNEIKSSFDILAFRIVEATQKWKEVTQCTKQGYKEQLEAHFNVKLSEALSDHCRYIGGNSSDLSISEVLNTNLGTEPAEIKGKGVGSGYGDESFERKIMRVVSSLARTTAHACFFSAGNNNHLHLSQSYNPNVCILSSVPFQSLRTILSRLPSVEPREADK